MITGGNATVFVANMDASLKFYNEVLGLKMSSHYGDHWASVEAGSFTIGLHPKSDKHPAPGTPRVDDDRARISTSRSMQRRRS